MKSPAAAAFRRRPSLAMASFASVVAAALCFLPLLLVADGSRSIFAAAFAPPSSSLSSASLSSAAAAAASIVVVRDSIAPPRPFGIVGHSRRTASSCAAVEHALFPLLHAHGRAAAARRGSVALRMGWGPEPIWSEAKVQSNSDACPSGSCVCLSLSVSGETAAGFTVPGQYVQVRPSGGDDNGEDVVRPIFLAIASPPAAAAAAAAAAVVDEADAAAGSPGSNNYAFEFLIKKTESNDWITSLPSGTTVSVSQVMGSGFPLSENLEGFKYDFPTQNILLFATGSGIAPIRSAIESRVLNVAPPGMGGRTARLYYGVRTCDDMPYKDRFDAWEEMGVEVVPVISQPESGSGGNAWDGRTGYVQNALEEDGVPIPRNSGALMCGVKGMTEAVRDILVKAGVFEGRVMTNF